MFTFRGMAAAALAAAMFACAATAARSDDCDGMKKSIQVLIDKIEDKPGDKTTLRCMAIGEMLGLLRIFRTVIDECTSDDDRFRSLARGDVVIRNLQSEADNLCR
jgi:hypothetical protein